jgi:hypothetical protein
MPSAKAHAAAVLCVGLLVASPSRAEIVVSHDAVGCVVAGKLPRFESGFKPLDAVVRARVYFRTSGTPNWYFVPMTRAGATFQGVLPKPLKTTRAIDYYIETLDAAANSSRSEEYTAQVVSGAGSCSRKLLVATVVAAAKVAVGLPAGISGLSLVPAGFAADGVVAAGAAGALGATSAAGGGGGAGAAGAGAATGGGLSTTALVIGGVAVAGGAAAVVASKSGGDSSNTSGQGTGSGTSAYYSVNFGAPPAGLNVSVCVGRSLSWNSQAIANLDAGGNFTVTWAPSDPNTLRVVGTVTATAVSATLTCVNGAGAAGSINATGGGGSYSGSFSFNGSQGPVTITRQP